MYKYSQCYPILVYTNGVIAEAEEDFASSFSSPVAPNIDDTDCDTFRAIEDVFWPIF